MARTLAVVGLVLCGGPWLVLEGCTLGSDTYVSLKDAPRSKDDGGTELKTQSKDGTSAAGACAGGKLAKQDLSKLEACQAGAHCYDKSKVPADLAPILAPCSDASKFCVPDEILAAGGDTLPSCTNSPTVASSAGPHGGCTNMALYPEIAKQAGSVLKQQECAAGMTCIPCHDPIHNVDSPFCKPIGVYGGDACAGASPAASDAGAPAPSQPCCTQNGKSSGVCTSSNVLPADKKDSMPQDVCAPDNVCMPAAMMEGKGTSCNAGLLFGPGVCMNTCFNGMLSVAGFFGILGGEGCGAEEICTPCSILEDSTPPGVAVPGCN